MKAKLVFEFHKTGDPLGKLNLGYKAKRDFKDYEELYQWIMMCPEVITDGKVQDWNEAFEENTTFSLEYGSRLEHSLSGAFSALDFLKWLLNNATINGFRPLLKQSNDNVYKKMKAYFSAEENFKNY